MKRIFSAASLAVVLTLTLPAPAKAQTYYWPACLSPHGPVKCRGLLDPAAYASSSSLPTGIPAPNIAAGTVTNTVFGYLANVTSDIQAQFNILTTSLAAKQNSLTFPLAISLGGTGASTWSANTFLAGPTFGSAAAPTRRQISALDLVGALTSPPNIGDTSPSSVFGSTLEAVASGYVGAMGRRRVSVSTSPTLVIAPYWLYAKDASGLYRSRYINSTTSFAVNATSASCPACTTLSIATRYYVYAVVAANFPATPSVTYEVSTTAPDTSLSMKSGDETRTYIATFRTYSTGDVQLFDASEGFYTYTDSTWVNTSGVIGTGCSSIAVFAPPHARAVWMHLDRTDAITTSASEALYSDNACTLPSVGQWCLAQGPTSGSFVRSASSTCVVSAARTYYLHGSTASVAGTLSELGFQE